MTDQLTPGQIPTIIAPDARTILVALALAEGVTLPIDDATRDWLANNGIAAAAPSLYSTSSDPHPGGFELTARAHAWLGSILAVPLPVQQTRWVDPRGDVAPRMISQDDLVAALGKALGRAVTPNPKTLVAVDAARMRVATQAQTQLLGEDGFPEVDPLPGFAEPDMQLRMTAPGTTPPGWQRDDLVTVQRRSGKVHGERGNLTGQQVIWGELGTGDDVLFYRKHNRPSDETPGTRVG